MTTGVSEPISSRLGTTPPRLNVASLGMLARVAAALLAAAAAGAAIGLSPTVALLLLATAVVLFAVRRVNTLAFVLLWTLPYMSVNLPTGSFTLKMSDAPAYLFAVAWGVRTLWRRDRVAWPPASVQVIVYLAALALSTLFSPVIPQIFRGDLAFPNRNAPELRSLSMIIWLGLSWLVVVGLYNVLGRSPQAYRRGVRVFILSSGLACLISLGMYFLAMHGYHFTEKSGGRDLVFDSGANAGHYLRLAGVAYEPLFLGFYLITTIPVTLTVLLMRPHWMSVWVLRAVLALQCLTMFLTFSAGGWAGLFVVLILLFPMLRPYVSRRSWTVLALGTALTVALCALALATHPKWQSIGTTIGTKVFQGGDDIRKAQWRVGYDLIDDYPILGVGPGMARFYFSRYHDTIRSQPQAEDYEINNVYINVFAESGIVGFAAFFWCAIAGIGALAIAIKRFGMANVPVLTALSASLVGCATQYASVNALFLIYFPVLIGLALAGVRLAHTDAERLPSRAAGIRRLTRRAA